MEGLSKTQIGIIVLFLLLSLNLFFIIRSMRMGGKGFEITKKIYTLKPNLSGKLTTNPDFVYGNNGWFIEGWEPELERSEIDWESDGWYENGTVDGRNNIIVIHPLDVETGRYIQRNVNVSKGSYELVVGIANVAGKMSGALSGDCNDVGFLIKIIDERGKETKVSDEVINTNDGWVDFSFNFVSPAKKSITVRVESYAGGPCGDWYSEWAAVDYIDIKKIPE